MRAEESLRRNIGGFGELLEAQAICINTQCGEEGKLQFVRWSTSERQQQIIMSCSMVDLFRIGMQGTSKVK